VRDEQRNTCAASIQERTQQLREQAKKRLDEAKIKSREARVDALKALAGAQVNRTENAIRKLEALIDKIQKVITALTDRGIDASAQQASLDKAKNLKLEIQTTLADLKAKQSSISSEGTESKRQVQVFMTAMNEIKKKLIELHRSLAGIIKELRKLAPPPSNSEANTSREVE
jgi:uncharacterized phage infection (PIP) family protein YhgE